MSSKSVPSPSQCSSPGRALLPKSSTALRPKRWQSRRTMLLERLGVPKCTRAAYPSFSKPGSPKKRTGLLQGQCLRFQFCEVLRKKKRTGLLQGECLDVLSVVKFREGRCKRLGEFAGGNVSTFDAAEVVRRRVSNCDWQVVSRIQT